MRALLGLPVGLLLGVVIHRGELLHSAVREGLGGTRGPQVRAYLVALGFLLLTVNGLAALGLLDLALPPVTPVAAIIGGHVFGAGMVVGKG
jgi:sulfur transporter